MDEINFYLDFICLIKFTKIRIGNKNPQSVNNIVRKNVCKYNN